MTAAAENLERLWIQYRLGESHKILVHVLERRTEGREKLLRHHRNGEVVRTCEIDLRAEMDQLLHGCSILEVGFRAGMLDDFDGRCQRTLYPYLIDSSVRRYFEYRYPLRLPAKLRERIERGKVRSEEPREPAWFARLLRLDASFRDPGLDRFLSVVDDFEYGDLNFDSLRELARDRDLLLDAVATPRFDRSPEKEALAGLERFLFFCRDLNNVIETAPSPSLTTAAFYLYRYWFRIRSGRLEEVVSSALSSLNESAGDIDALPERNSLHDLFERAQATRRQRD